MIGVFWGYANRLPSRYREVVMLREFNGWEFTAIGVRLGISRSRAFQIYRSALRGMRRMSKHRISPSWVPTPPARTPSGHIVWPRH